MKITRRKVLEAIMYEPLEAGEFVDETRTKLAKWVKANLPVSFESEI